MQIKTFIDRPLLSMVISVMITAVGVIALLSLPVEKYPDIAPPTINVWASYPGASAEAVQKSVIAPLEESINGVENMTYMTANATNGSGSLTIYFKQGSNPDMAAVNVQNRVTQAQGSLPAEVLRIGVMTMKEQPGQLRTIGIESPGGTYDGNFLSNFFHNNVEPALLRIHGVGKVEIWGCQYALRVWLHPDAMARHGLVPSDISNVFAEQNIEASIGSIGENSNNVYQYTLRYTGRKSEIPDFENMVITSKTSGEELKLKDVADLELGQDSYSFCNSLNGHEGVMGMVTQVAGSNATSINIEIDKLLDEIRQTMPKDIRIISFDNTNDFLFASIREVLLSLALAIVLVLIVVYFFLQDFRATLIPAIGIIVSLVGTFAFMSLAGFSINLLTLFALVLVIGTVVDNSIVVVEAVQSRFDNGYKSAYEASVDAMGGLTTALFTTTLVFMVIFIPMSFMSGTTGIFYKQFGLTMAVAVGISFINAISLSPALCALILKPKSDEDKGFSAKVGKAYQTTYTSLLKHYTGGAMKFIRNRWLVAGSIAVAALLSIVLMRVVPTGFVPDEDCGDLFVDIVAPAGYTQNMTKEVAVRISEQIQQIPAVQYVGTVMGFALASGQGSDKASIFVQLKPWKERKGKKNSVYAVEAEINEILSHQSEAKSFAMMPGMIDGYGAGGGFEFSIENRNGQDIHTFYDIAQNYLSKLNQRPEIGMAYSAYEINYPQYSVDVDASRCKKMNVSPASVLSEMSGYLGSAYISNLNLYSKVYQVDMQVHPEDRDRLEDLDNLFVRSNSGEMLPISQFLTIKKEFMPQALKSFNRFNSISVNGTMAPGRSSGDAIKAIREVAAQELPVGYSIEFSGITREESQTGSNIIFIFLVCIVFCYLVMVALYESLFIPLAVMLAIPFGIAGSFLFASLFGVENNIYLQVGLIMLIGLLAKTAILLTEFASQCRRAGMSLKQAAFFSAKMRLRPILMTSLTMIFGMLPLMFASGVGANGSRTIGVGTIGGMLIGTLGLLFITPALFVIFQTLEEKFKPIKFTPTDDPLILNEMKLIEEYREKKNNK